MTSALTSSAQVSVSAYPLPPQVSTPEEALSIIQSLRAHFDFTGTEFVAEDAADAVKEIMSEADPEYVALLAPALTRAIQEDTRWSRLRDSLAERGNEIVADIALEIAGDLASIPLGDDQAYVIVATTKSGRLIREATVRSSEHVPTEVTRSKREPGVDEVRVGVRTAGEDADLYLV